MDAMIRASKGALALLALAGLGLLLRWMTAASISGLKSYDLDSLTVLAVGTVAWIAYGWLVLAVVLTVLEQLPGAVGALAGAVAGRVTTKTARALLRSGLGVAAVTPLTVGVAHATPGDTTHVRPWTQPEPTSSVHLTNTWHPTEPSSTEQLPPTAASTPQTLAGPGPQSTANLGPQSTDGFARRSANDFSAGSTAAFGTQVPPAARQLPADAQSWRATEPPSTVQIGSSDTNVPPIGTNSPSGANAMHQPEATTAWRATEPPSKIRFNQPSPTNHPTHRLGTSNQRVPGQPSQQRPVLPGRPTTPNRPATPARPTMPVRPTAPDHLTTPGHPNATTPPATRGQSTAPGGTAVPTQRTAPAQSAGNGSSRPDGSASSGTGQHGELEHRGQPAERYDSGQRGEPGQRGGSKQQADTGRQADGDPAVGLPKDRRMRIGVPDRPTAGAPTRYTDLRSGVPVEVAGRVVVREGDSLWTIAARELGPRASDAAVSARWREWYAANRQLIGNDPNLIHPGQVLRVPRTAPGNHVPPTSPGDIAGGGHR